MRALFLFIIFIASTCIAQSTPKFVTGLQENVFIGEADGIPLSINIALPKNNKHKARPALVYIHGGGLIKGDKSRFNKQITRVC